MVIGVKPIEEAELDFGQVRSFHFWVLILRTRFQSNVVLVIAGIHCRVVHRLASDVDISSVSCGLASRQYDCKRIKHELLFGLCPELRLSWFEYIEILKAGSQRRGC